MNGQANIGILVQDGNDFSLLGKDNTTSSDNRDVIDAVVVDALNINLAFCVGNYAYIFSCNASIGTTVN